FAANATTYWFNTAFRFKMLAILLAGLNMLVFQFVTFRGVPAWDRNAPTPTAARLAGALSILIWTSVIFLGRWIGFTNGYDVPVPEGMDFDFSRGCFVGCAVARPAAVPASRSRSSSRRLHPTPHR